MGLSFASLSTDVYFAPFPLLCAGYLEPSGVIIQNWSSTDCPTLSSFAASQDPGWHECYT